MFSNKVALYIGNMSVVGRQEIEMIQRFRSGGSNSFEVFGSFNVCFVPWGVGDKIGVY